MVQLAFYKADGSIYDKAIRVWTRSKYSHTELVVDEKCYSSSGRDDGVREKEIDLDSEKWDVVDLHNIESIDVWNFFYKTRECRYDYLGIFLSQFLPLKLHNKQKWFCSEWCAEAMGIKDAHELSPQDLFEYVKGLK